MNKVMLLGRLTADPELKNTMDNIPICNFTVAVNRMNGEADFIPCVAWKKTAETICTYFNRGRMIAVEGSIHIRKYKDRDGNNRTAFDVNVERVYFASDKPKAEDDTFPTFSETTPVPDDELPF